MKNKKLKKLISKLNSNEYSTDFEVLKKHCIDWRGEFRGDSDLIIFPRSVRQISKILKFCYKNNIAIVPQGGNTGLVGGAVPRKKKNEIIINLSNLNNIREIDQIGACVQLII